VLQAERQARSANGPTPSLWERQAGRRQEARGTAPTAAGSGSRSRVQRMQQQLRRRASAAAVCEVCAVCAHGTARSVADGAKAQCAVKMSYQRAQRNMSHVIEVRVIPERAYEGEAVGSEWR